MGLERNFFIQKGFYLMLMLLYFGVVNIQVSSINEDGSILLEFKKSLSDPQNSLHDWNSSDLTPCNWTGVHCNDSVITSINLSDLNLSGSLSPIICDLPHLVELNLSMNFISGPIPVGFAACNGSLQILDLCINRFHGELENPLCQITSLRKLYLCENFMHGEVPQEIGNLTSLEELVIYGNNLTGRIPESISQLKQLRIIKAGFNSLSGPIPAEISECESLELLGLAQNQLQGSIPRELQKLQNLTTIHLYQNFLSGEIPPEVGNMSRLELLALHQNLLSGVIPKELGKLSHLQTLYLYTNRLNGTIPPELGNLTSALELDLSENLLSGTIPKELGLISDLGLLHLFENHLQGEIPWELGQLWLLNTLDLSINNLTGTIPLVFQNLTYMVDLQLFDNQLEGKIPPDLGARSNLSVLDLSANNLVGMIPAHLCKNQKLKFLSLGSNKLSGNIPYDLKTCKSLVQLMLGNNQLTGGLSVELNELQNLSALELHQNRFTGIINPGIGQLQNLMRLLLSDNHFFGHLPPEIGKLAQLVSFNVSSNHLSGSIPNELGNCVKLQRLDLSQNQFTGTVPDEIGKLVNLELLKLSDNKFSGAIPSNLGDLTHLTELELGGNLFSGSIPIHMEGLTALQIALNMSHNKLSGVIPVSLRNLQMLEFLYLNDNELVGEIPASIGDLPSLLVCNVSNNNLTGTIPDTPAFQKMDLTNFAGNNRLCRLGSYNCHSPKSPTSTPKQTCARDGSSRKKIVSIVSGVIGLVSLAFIVCICRAMKRKSPSSVSLERQTMPNAINNYYFPKEGFTYQDLLEATGNFSEAAIIGNGACGTVYKATMADGEVIAVKKLNSCGGERANVVDRSFLAEISTLGKIRHRNIVKLYGFSFQQDSKILLYEYMENGSLGEQLHANPESCPLDWNCRYKIALGAAQGLCYLHYDCKPQIIHRDIKSNNILLDKNFQACVGDFGLAKLIDFSYSKSMTTTVAGSYGYIAPEYAYTMKVTEKCDIYSFGVVLLELVTGRSPIQPLEHGGDLVSWVRRSIQSSVPTLELFDKRLNLSEKRTIEEMSLVQKIALFCTSASPVNRPTMKEVITMLIDAREYVSNSTSESSHDDGT